MGRLVLVLKYSASLTSVAQLVRHRPAKWRVTGLIPGQGTRDNPSMFLSHIDISLLLFVFSLSLKINKILKKI